VIATRHYLPQSLNCRSKYCLERFHYILRETFLLQHKLKSTFVQDFLCCFTLGLQWVDCLTICFWRRLINISRHYFFQNYLCAKKFNSMQQHKHYWHKVNNFETDIYLQQACSNQLNKTKDCIFIGVTYHCYFSFIFISPYSLDANLTALKHFFSGAYGFILSLKHILTIASCMLYAK